MSQLPHTILEPGDDPAFLTTADRLIAALVRRRWPEDVYLVHIDNWFDHKWLRYSGYGLVNNPDGFPYLPTAKKEYRQDHLTFPPFVPSRVVAQYLFCRIASDAYEEHAPAHLVHPHRRQRSARNLHRRVTDFSRSALFVWYASGSSANRRSSLLVYEVDNSLAAAWYASFSDRCGWQLDQVKGIDRETVMTLMSDKPPVQTMEPPIAADDSGDTHKQI